MTTLTVKEAIRSSRLSGFELLCRGLRGVKVSYQTIEVQDSVSYSNEHVDKRHRPVHDLVRQLLAQLSVDFLELMGYGEEAKVSGGDVEVIGVKAGKEAFEITAEVRLWQDRTLQLTTPKITIADGYEEFHKVMEVVDKAYAEVNLYMKGLRKAEKKQVIADYMRIIWKENTSYEDFEKMSAEEQATFIAEMEKEIGMKVVEEDGKNVLASTDEVPDHDVKPAKKRKSKNVTLSEKVAVDKSSTTNGIPESSRNEDFEPAEVSSEMADDEPLL